MLSLPFLRTQSLSSAFRPRSATKQQPPRTQPNTAGEKEGGRRSLPPPPLDRRRGWRAGGKEGRKEGKGRRERGGGEREAAAVSEACNVLLHCALQLNAYVHALNVSHSASLPTYRQFRNFALAHALWFGWMSKASFILLLLMASSYPLFPPAPSFRRKNPKKAAAASMKQQQRRQRERGGWSWISWAE